MLIHNLHTSQLLRTAAQKNHAAPCTAGFVWAYNAKRNSIVKNDVGASFIGTSYGLFPRILILHYKGYSFGTCGEVPDRDRDCNCAAADVLPDNTLQSGFLARSGHSHGHQEW
eukprot:CAMPEP_0114240462 /NCGR_PEP_ID=MMETSP0058-20121206/9085_1 /TAXON_ID=36894 /ORGANISM="Pyramimonas parkeae, CCMP726" /LENGTH=112 /DNA_ID=CAMNT_0001352869 /DNA_START=758 /DNA_END=1093 /DNA_ORIENTATION=-